MIAAMENMAQAARVLLPGIIEILISGTLVKRQVRVHLVELGTMRQGQCRHVVLPTQATTPLIAPVTPTDRVLRQPLLIR